MKKRLFGMLLTIFVLFSVMSLQVFAADPVTSGSCGYNVTWSFDGNSGTLTISGTGRMSGFTYGPIFTNGTMTYSHNIPWYDLRESIKSVVIENGVTNIGSEAFRMCKNLTEIEIPDSVTVIENAAFRFCESLNDVTIPNSVVTIEDGVFNACKSLTRIEIPNSVTSIGKGVFTACEGLRDVTIPNSVSSIGKEMFQFCYALTDIDIPNSVTSIGDNAFYECKGLMGITIPASVSSIGEYAFTGCESLTEITIPDSVTSIGAFAFEGCVGLKKVIIPASVTTIERGTFSGCKSLSEVTIPDSVAAIGESAFIDCRGLKEITIPNGVTAIENHTFSVCEALTSVTIPHTVTSIGEEAFTHCKNLREVTIPTSVTSIADRAFYQCNYFTTIYYYGNQGQWNEIAIGKDAIPGRVRVRFIEPPACQHEQQKTVPAVAATCSENGLTEGVICGSCGEIITAQQVVAAKGHEYDKQQGKCLVCGTDNPFTDVSSDAWYRANVLWAVRSDITGGTGLLTFSPDADCTRGQIVTFLWAANGRPMPKSTDNPFVDVSKDAYYANAVLWAVEQGITGGTTADTFSPDAPCTRAQVATFLYAAQGKPALTGNAAAFADVTEDAWYRTPVMWAVENGVTNGIGNGKFGPEQTCTRAQIVTFLSKVYNK